MSQAIWTAFEYIASLTDALIIMRFVCAFFGNNFSTRKGILVYASGSLILWASIVLLNSISTYEGLLGMLYILVIFLFALIFLKGEILPKLFVAVGTNLILIISSSLGSGFIMGITGAGQEVFFADAGIYRFLMIITVQLLRLYFFEIILKFMKKGTVRLNTSEWALIVFTFAISAVLFVLIHSVQIISELTTRQMFYLTVVEAGLSLLNVVCFGMVVRFSKNHMLESENELLKQQIEFREQYAENTRLQEQELRTIRHDMKNSISVIETLMSEGKLESAKNYLKQLREEKLNVSFRLFTENEFVNAIVSTRFSYAAGLGINTFCSSISKFPNISDVDLCNLIGNLLDNAIEACSKCDGEKQIEMKIVKKDGKIIITVVNTIKDSVLDKNPGLLTSKLSSKFHGFGIPSIRNIAEKYNGSVDFYEEDGLFHSQVMILEPQKNIQ